MREGVGAEIDHETPLTPEEIAYAKQLAEEYGTEG